jgi:hypothetical protein
MCDMWEVKSEVLNIVSTVSPCTGSLMWDTNMNKTDCFISGITTIISFCLYLCLLI